MTVSSSRATNDVDDVIPAMSTVERVGRNLLTQCPICLEEYRIPRALPCLHTFCEACLVDYIKLKNQPGIRVSGFGTFVCPVCKDTVTLPPQGITGFKHNFYIASFAGNDSAVTSHRQHDTDATISLDHSLNCQRCEEPGVSKICLKCAHWLCPLCCDDHNRVRSTRDHVLTSLAELTNAAVPDTVSTNDLAACTNPAHDCNTFKFFCVSCKVLACDHCQVEEHSAETHDVLSVIINIDGIRRKLLEHLASLQERSLVYQSQHAELVRYRKDMTRRYHTAQKSVFKTVDMLQRRMVDFKNHIYRELRKSLTSQTVQMENHLSELGSKIALLNSVEGAVKAVLENGSNRNILTQADGLMARGDSCLEEKAEFGKLLVKFPKVEVVDKIRVDKLLYELIGTVSILSKDIDVGPAIERLFESDSGFTDDEKQRTFSSDGITPAKRGMTIPLILTKSCPTVDQLNSPTENSASDVISEKLRASPRDLDPLSEGEEAIASRLPFPSPKHHQQGHLHESESQSTTCDDDSDSAMDDKSLSRSHHVTPQKPPSGPFYDNPEQEEFWMPQCSTATVRRAASPRRRLQPSSPRKTRVKSPSPSRANDFATPPSPPAKLMARRIKPFIKKWKERQSFSSSTSSLNQ